MEIETSRLRLRLWREEDVESYARICADPESMRYLLGGNGSPLTYEQSAEQITSFMRRWEEWGYGPWAVEHKATGDLIGRIGLNYYEDFPASEYKTEVGWLLDRAYWGRGLATEGAAASYRYGFRQVGLERIIGVVKPANLASRRIMEKFGLSFQGRTRFRGHDMIWYAAYREEWLATFSRVLR